MKLIPVLLFFWQITREILDANVRWAKCTNPPDYLFGLVGARDEGDGGLNPCQSKFPSDPLCGGISRTRLEGN